MSTSFLFKLNNNTNALISFSTSFSLVTCFFLFVRQANDGCSFYKLSSRCDGENTPLDGTAKV